jgi:5-oxoprolinase (ATP-hydrolysing)
MEKNYQFRFSIDRGGTFTDIYCQHEEGFIIEKLLSVDPQNYEDAPREGIRRIMQKVMNKKFKTAKEIPEDQIKWIRMGTTVATNALLERKG